VVQTSFGGGTSDAFATTLNSAGSTLVYATYVGGSSADSATGIALDNSGNAYVVGTTSSTNFPTTSGSYQPSYGGGASNAFVAKLNSSGTTLVYSTYVGTTTVTGNAIAVDRSGQAYLTGQSGSAVLVDALNAAGSTLVYGKTISGNGTNTGYGIAVDSQGRVSVTGSTSSNNLPTTSGAYQSSSPGFQPAFVAQYSSGGTLTYLSYLGGSFTATGYAVAVTPTGAAVVVGKTNSSNFPTSGGAYQTSNGGGTDAFVSEFTRGAAPPRITAITTDTGASSSDAITSSQNLHILGTATPSTTVTLERADVGVLGAAAVSSGGTFSYDYSGTTLAEGTWDFVARDDDGSTSKSAYSPDFLVTVDRTAPTVNVGVPASTSTLAPQVRITASDLAGIAANATVALDLATSSSGPWTLGYATGTLTNDQATITLPTLSSTGTWYVRARVLDLAGNQGTSTVQSVSVNSVTSWSGSATALSADPEQGDWLMQMGDNSFSHALDLDQSPGTAQSGDPALVYHSSQVSQQPIVQVQLSSANNASLPANVTAQLTLGGTAAGTVTYSTTGFSAGDTLTMALQSSTAITTTGRYDYSVTVQAGSYNQTFTGYTFVVAQDSSALGAGWGFAGVDMLVPLSASGSDPAGVLRVYGDGGSRFYQGTTSFTSPPGDNGTLSLSGTTYTYSTPDGQSWTFSTSGSYAYLTQWTSADGQETLQYRYDGSHRLAGITAIDGALSTFTYNAGNVVIQTVNSRTTTLTLSSGNLASVTNPDGGVETLTYDSNHRLTQEQLGLVASNWAYSSTGVLTTETAGRGSVGGVNNPSVTTFTPALTQGLSTLVAGTVYANLTDPDGNTTLQQMDSQGRPLTQVAADGGVTTLTYSNGFLSSLTDPLNRTTTYVRDSAAYVTLQTLPDGSMITYQYQSAFHARTTLVDERNNTTTYAYDASGHITSVTDALSHPATASYTANGLLQSITDQFGHTTTYLYDGNRRLTASVDAMNNQTTLGYDANGNVLTVKDALGRVTTTNYDVMGRLTGTADALGNRTTATNDVSGLVLTSTDATGVLTSRVYDAFSRGWAAETFTGAGSAVVVSNLNSYDPALRLTATRDALGSWTQMHYDGVGRLTSTTDVLGNTSQMDYDLAGQLTASRDAMGNWTRYAYNSRGDQTSVTDPLGNVTTSAFDKAHNRTTVTDPLNHTITYVYDALNRATKVTDALGDTGTLAYDAGGNLFTVTDLRGNVTSYAYDALNRLTTQTDAVGTSVQRTVQLGYDAVSNVTSRTDALNNVTTLAYDGLHRVTSSTDALNHTVTLGYDALNDIVTPVNALNLPSTFSYDTLHRLVAVTDPLGHTATLVRDAKGDTAATVDPLGNVTVAIIDLLGRTVGNVDALGNVAQVVLNPDGEARMVIDPVGNEAHYVVDGLGRDTVTIDPLGNRTTAAYDAAGRLTQMTDRDGRVMQYRFDNANRETGEVWKNAAGATVDIVTYGYDAVGNRTSAADSNGTVIYTYDALNRLSSYTSVFGQVLTYTYNGDNNVTQRTDSLGGTLTYVYDNAQRLTSEQFSGTGPTGTVVRVDFGYDNRNEQTSTTWYSNLVGTSVVATSASNYDNAGRVTSIVNKDSTATTLSYYDYSYDNADRVSNQTWWSKIGTVTYSGSVAYSYDATGQLTSDGTNSYSFDGNGNRTMAGYSTGVDNRMSSDGTYTYYYDNAGNMIEKTKGSGQETWYYGYDNRNALTSIRETSDSTTNTLTVTYTYDVEGKRVKEQDWSTGSSTVETRYAYDGRNIWADLDSSNSLLVRRMFGPDDQVLTRTVASGTTAGVWAYFTDNLGSVRDLVNWSSQVQDHLDYSGFGVLTETTAAVGDGYAFTGLKEQKAAGVLLADNRAYLLSTGRWMELDPIVFRGGDANLYRYVGNSPTSNVDPSGLLRGGGRPGPRGGIGSLLSAALDALPTVWTWLTAPADPAASVPPPVAAPTLPPDPEWIHYQPDQLPLDWTPRVLMSWGRGNGNVVVVLGQYRPKDRFWTYPGVIPCYPPAHMYDCAAAPVGCTGQNGVFSTPEALVNYLADVHKPGSIDVLVLSSHGSSGAYGGFSIVSWNNPATPGVSSVYLDANTNSTTLQALANLLSPNAVVILDACGACSTQTEMEGCQALANALGHVVIATNVCSYGPSTFAVEIGEPSLLGGLLGGAISSPLWPTFTPVSPQWFAFWPSGGDWLPGAPQEEADTGGGSW
jgi:RHS repeat-associated protein